MKAPKVRQPCDHSPCPGMDKTHLNQGHMKKRGPRQPKPMGQPTS